MSRDDPFSDPPRRTHRYQDFTRNEVLLALRNHGLPLEALRYDITPVGLHYTLNHFDIPFVDDPQAWRLRVTGRVKRALSLSLSDLRALPAVTQTITLECAGNGRALAQPRWPSQPWHNEAVGTGSWTGTSLAAVLERAGLEDDAVDIAFFGADRGVAGGIEHSYGRALSPADALKREVMLAWAMNAQPLLPQHGFPLRLVVPGWFGMASVKWLNRIEVLDRPFSGYQQVGTYVLRDSADDPGTPVRSTQVKALMVPPGIPDWYTRNRLVDAGRVELTGRAWSGEGIDIDRVEVAVNDTWQLASLEPSIGRFAWRGWRLDWDAKPGRYRLGVRAKDVAGRAQPLETVWNHGGFANNEVQWVDVWVRAAG